MLFAWTVKLTLKVSSVLPDVMSSFLYLGHRLRKLGTDHSRSVLSNDRRALSSDATATSWIEPVGRKGALGHLVPVVEVRSKVVHLKLTDTFSCSVTCGGGYQVRSRACSITNRCEGEPTEHETCNAQACPAVQSTEPQWTDWTSWNQCSVRFRTP